MTLVYSLAEAAKELREAPESLQKELECGMIPAYKKGRNWKIPKDLLRGCIENRALDEAKRRRELHENQVEQGKV